ncbi:MAG: tRNA epoxyqueuosine(34) reductase QueG [Nitrospinales bacterium]
MNETPLQLIKQEAHKLGFDGFGIAPPCLDKAVDRFRHWLARHYEGEMAYMSRWTEKRADLQKILPGVKSVICLRTDYLTTNKTLAFLEEPETGDISLYALNEDYHDIITSRLKVLEETIHNQFPNCSTKIYVDTGPVLEKPLAQKAGLGWIGKHTNLITEGKGSWYFLSEILVDIAFPVSGESVDRCGTCRQCIDICPTQAIVEPYVLDARRCISYLNIELRGVIPVEFRKAIGNHIFGCDDCQIVCPWNSFAVPGYEKRFQEPLTTRRLIDLIQLDDESFRRRFRKSPIKRIKRRGFLRNVAVALGNSGDPQAAAPLTAVLKDKEPLIRAHAVWALGELLREESLPLFDEHLAEEKEEMVLAEIRGVKARLKPGRVP